MLIIRKDQFDRLAEDELARTKKRMKIHLKKVFPLQTSFVSDKGVNEFIESCIGQARSIGFETEPTVQSFIDHTVLLGFDFCHNPLFTEISAPLFDTEVEDLIQRHDILYDQAWEYLDTTRGNGAVNLLRASSRLKNLLKGQISTASKDLPSLLGILKDVYPEKYGAHNEETVKLFCAKAFRRAKKDNFEQISAQVLYVTTAFLAGIDFFHDPLIMGTVPEQVAALEKTSDPFERTKLLSDGVEIYLNSLFEAFRKLTITGGR